MSKSKFKWSGARLARKALRQKRLAARRRRAIWRALYPAICAVLSLGSTAATAATLLTDQTEAPVVFALDGHGDGGGVAQLIAFGVLCLLGAAVARWQHNRRRRRAVVTEILGKDRERLFLHEADIAPVEDE